MENKIIEGDCLEVMKEIEDNSVDLIVTDPPFGIGFMGKSWDTFKSGYQPDSWKGWKTDPRLKGGSMQAGKYDHSIKGNMLFQEFIYQTAQQCLRILKDGAFMFMCMTPRQDSLARTIIAIEDAGFNTGFTSIYWTYASGFPKAGNIGKMVDKRMGVKRKQVKTTGGLHKNTNLNDDNWHKIGDNEAQMASVNPVTPQAKALDGSYAGFQPKPAVEVILVAMKPISEKTYVDQALKNGKGITWLDDVRVPYESEGDKENTRWGFQGGKEGEFLGEMNDKRKNYICSTNGRFPANLLVSDDRLNDGNNRKSIKSKEDKIAKGGIWNKSAGKPAGPTYSDNGSFSRYFSLDKWFAKQLKKLPIGVQKTFPFLIVPKASKGEKNRGLEGLSARFSKTMNNGIGNREHNPKEPNAWVKNNHPTVKPLKLMSYLITLGSREGDLVLDPFVGSGTTCIACKQLNRRFIGIDNNSEYVEIAKARLSKVQANLFAHCGSEQCQ